MQPPPALSSVSYGSDLCANYNSTTKLRYGSLSHFIYNLISVKNVYFADYGGEAVVMKKLGHKHELAQITAPKTNLFNEMSRLNSVKFCDGPSIRTFLQEALVGFTAEQIGTMVQINIEPLMLHVFRNLKIFPEYLGACGHFVIVKDCGRPLNDFAGADWHIRAYLAIQLLQAARDMTEQADFRLYLTDISPDNVAVDSSLNVYFVDVENAIVSSKEETYDHGEHYSRHSDKYNHFAFEPSAICQSGVSDHNIYGVCYLMLSLKAPWPMMKYGLLHTPPYYLKPQWSQLYLLIEECVQRPYGSDRFKTSLKLIQSLQKILLIN